LKVPRGGGVKLSALMEAVSSTASDSSNTSSNEKPVVSLEALRAAAIAKNYIIFCTDLQERIINVPQNGTLNIDMGNWISFNKKTFEAFSKRSDVDIVIEYYYQGQKYSLTIPAGYPIMNLLDENGYCGCLYLNSIFGSKLVD